jgi:hypothetical protein
LTARLGQLPGGDGWNVEDLTPVLNTVRFDLDFELRFDERFSP